MRYGEVYRTQLVVTGQTLTVMLVCKDETEVGTLWRVVVLDDPLPDGFGYRDRSDHLIMQGRTKWVRLE